MINNTIKVWDPLVRIFHWGLVAFFTTAFLTGDEESMLHIYAGYTVIGLVLFRIVWGFVGSDHARFGDFVFSPGKVIDYLKSVPGGSSKRYIGHNPAGGYMVVAMLITLLVVCITGLKVYAAEGHGPLAANAETSLIVSAHAEEGSETGEKSENKAEEFWEEIHEAASYFMLVLVALHIIGVVVSGRMHNENLVKAMITGNKDA